MRANQDIRSKMRETGLTMWEVAAEVGTGIHETTLVRWLRTELTGEKREKVLIAIEAALDKKLEAAQL